MSVFTIVLNFKFAHFCSITTDVNLVGEHEW